jgi:putative Mn2+ efflux pump MntP
MHPMATLLENLFIAVALAMDAFAVALAMGAVTRGMKIRHALIVGAWFGAFQAFMPLLGWGIGIATRQWVESIDHWIIFALLGFIGGKMIYESFQIRKAEEHPSALKHSVLFMLALATSVDALGVGVTFAMRNVEIMTPALIIGIVTFLISFAGFLLGERGRHFFEIKIEVLGGLILIGIGLKILISHLSGA